MTTLAAVLFGLSVIGQFYARDLARRPVQNARDHALHTSGFSAGLFLSSVLIIVVGFFG